MTATQADFATTKTILEAAGIPVVGQAVATQDQAISVANAIGYPIVMKLISADIIHKTDAGVVKLDIENEQQAGQSYDEILANAMKAGATQIDGVLVQQQAKPGFELLVGARQDPVFGPVTMVGSGGRYVELLKDVSPGVGVLCIEDVDRMLSATKAGRIVDGYRGPRLDRAGAIDLAIKVSKLMAARPEVRELDLNPVILYESGFAVVDARMILGEPVVHPRAEDLSQKRLASLRAMFEARSVAVVGASRPGSIGGIILKNSSRLGKLYPVNPKRESLMGLKCYPDIKSIPEVPDVAVFAVSPPATIAGFK
ncbi:MAG: acetate--CoA ligase family protein, partial [Polyangiaceae bacterium]|nr:acetate--CoA ligase family protein [Polyangiaceae bacterium]